MGMPASIFNVKCSISSIFAILEKIDFSNLGKIGFENWTWNWHNSNEITPDFGDPKLSTKTRMFMNKHKKSIFY